MKITEFMELSERERDAFVAREVMVWREGIVTDEMVEAHSNDAVVWKGNDVAIWPPMLKCGWAEHSGYYWETFEPTTEWNSMRLVVEKMRDSQFSIRMAFVHRLKEQYIIDDRHTIHPEYIVLYLEPNKVCIAALLALGKLEE